MRVTLRTFKVGKDDLPQLKDGQVVIVLNSHGEGELDCHLHRTTVPQGKPLQLTYLNDRNFVENVLAITNNVNGSSSNDEQTLSGGESVITPRHARRYVAPLEAAIVLGSDSSTGEGSNEIPPSMVTRLDFVAAQQTDERNAEIIPAVKKYLTDPKVKMTADMMKIATLDIPESELDELIRLATGIANLSGLERDCSKSSVAECIGYNTKVRAKVLADIEDSDKQEHLKFIAHNPKHRFAAALLQHAPIADKVSAQAAKNP